MKKEKEIVTPIHPGRVLWLTFLEEDFSALEHLIINIDLESYMDIPTYLIGILAGDIGLNKDVCKALAEHYGNSVKFWQNLQKNYDKSVKMGLVKK